MATSERGTWVCRTCGKRHEGLALGFTAKAPVSWEQMSWFERRGSTLGDEICIVKRQLFFVRGLIQIPIRNRRTPFIWNVWSSLSPEAFQAMLDRWPSPDRAADPPYEGLLANELSVGYAGTLNLKLIVHTREPGQRPNLELEPADHQLAIDQRNGMTIDRVREINSLLLHSKG